MRQVVTAALAAFAALVLSLPAQANGRQPCDRGAGGVSHCANGKFICNNGTVSGSKKVCSSGNTSSRGASSAPTAPSRSRDSAAKTRRDYSSEMVVIQRRPLDRGGNAIEEAY